MIKARLSGMTYSDIGRKFGVTRQRVHQILCHCGIITRRSEARKDAVLDKMPFVKEFVRAGMSQQQIAAKLRLSYWALADVVRATRGAWKLKRMCPICHRDFSKKSVSQKYCISCRQSARILCQIRSMLKRFPQIGGIIHRHIHRTAKSVTSRSVLG
jgi:Trp operon repressor